MGKRVTNNTKITALIVVISLLLGVFLGNLVSNTGNVLQNEVNISLGKESEQREIVDINHASKAQLMSLDGIGEKKAKDIIANRPYSDIWDLVNKKIVGKDTFNKIKDRLEVY